MTSQSAIEPNHLYTPEEAAPLLEIKAETVKKHCRSGDIRGKQIGAKKVWRVPGQEILRKRREWNLDN